MKLKVILALCLMATSLILAACVEQTPSTVTFTLPPETPSPTQEPPTATPSPTPAPPRALTICQAEEPNSLFLYGNPSPAARMVMEAIYDGPIDAASYEFVPVLLDKLPSLEDGDALWRTVDVREGESVVDVHGQVMDLTPGVAVENAAGEEVVFEGGVVTMTQLMVTFMLRDDATWSDGQPVIAADSVYSYELAGQMDVLPPTLELLVERTSAYEPLGEGAVVWTSLPGYEDTFYLYDFALQNYYFTNFFHPLPSHVWRGAALDYVLNAESAHRQPVGWGPFVVEEWQVGEYLTLVRNANYFRADEGLPRLDRVTFRFVDGTRETLAMIRDGRCDVVPPRLVELDHAAFEEAAHRDEIELSAASGAEWEHLDFGVASVPWYGRPDFFADVRVRQAVAQCIDRERIAEEAYPSGRARVAQSYVSAEHPLYAGPELRSWSFDPTAGQELLAEAGWVDGDGDGWLEAQDVTGVSSGTPFSVTLITTSDDAVRERVATRLVEDLATCGIGVSVETYPEEEFFADGPDGPVLGRRFDLALFSWRNDLDPQCGLYLSSQVTDQENWWSASNVTGYESEQYDAACRSALEALPGTEAYVRHHREAQRVFSQDLPSLPLYHVPQRAATRPGVEGVVPDPIEPLTWNIEQLDTQSAGEGD